MAPPTRKGVAWIIPVGNELLIGRIVDTNSAWLARRLTFLGYRVARVVKVPDDVDEASEEIRRAIERAEVVITTGGLGPTYDDRTLEAVAKAVGVDLKLNREALALVEEFYKRKGLPLTRERTKMAMLPEGAKPIPNPVGAAPGSIVEYSGALVISLPGVPREMQAMFDLYVKPILEERAPPRRFWECSLEVRGVPESSLAPKLEEVARRYPSTYIKSHPRGHELEEPVIDVRILASGETLEEAVSIAVEARKKLLEEAKRLGGRVHEGPCKTPD